jgi:geranylgeranyl diphosphate synthase type II
MQNSEELLKIIDENIRQLELDKSPAELYSPISYTLNAKGKRIRPLMTLLACQMFSDNIENAISSALGLEVFHNFTLLHDDIMDNASVRRGLPTVHTKWSVNTAILSGDAMMIEAYRLISSTPDSSLKEVLDVFSKTALGVCEGQMFDMQYEERTDVTEDEYIKMIGLKTSVLLAGSLKIGALIGGASKEDADLLYKVGMNVGLAFQLKDDWLDVYSNPEVFGKKTGGDIVTNKKTYLLINALQKADDKNKKLLLQWLSRKDFDDEDKIKEIKKIYNTLEIDKLTLQRAKEYSDKAFGYLEKINVEEQKKSSLIELIKQLLERDK